MNMPISHIDGADYNNAIHSKYILQCLQFKFTNLKGEPNIVYLTSLRLLFYAYN